MPEHLEEPEPDIPMSGWIDIWLEEVVEPEQSETTTDRYRRAKQLQLDPHIGVKGGEKTCHWGVVGQGKCPGKCSAKMSLRYAAMVSDVDGLGTIRCCHPGGPPASR